MAIAAVVSACQTCENRYYPRLRKDLLLCLGHAFESEGCRFESYRARFRLCMYGPGGRQQVLSFSRVVDLRDLVLDSCHFGSSRTVLTDFTASVDARSHKAAFPCLGLSRWLYFWRSCRRLRSGKLDSGSRHQGLCRRGDDVPRPSQILIDC